MKKLIITVFLLLACAGLAYAQAADFTKANASYRDGKYDEAIAAYESILKSGYESGPIYYNLANSYFKKQQIGKAILNYERAKRLTPRDFDLAANSQFALSAVVNEVHKPLNFWDKLWQGHLRFYSFNEMVIILSFLLVALGAAHLVTLYFNWKAGRLVMSALAALILIFAYGLNLKISAEHNVAMMIDSTAARFEPNDKATVYFELPAGQQVFLGDRESGWVKIERPDGKSGWVGENTLEAIELKQLR
jgi:tetratricopeptide (TPR) repeat protein